MKLKFGIHIVFASVLAIAQAHSQTGIKELLTTEDGKHKISLLPKDDLMFFDGFLRSSKIEIEAVGSQRSTIELKDKAITSALEMSNGKALLTGTRGHIYVLDLNKQKIESEFEISSNTQTLQKAPNGQILSIEGLLSIEKVHFIEDDLSINPLRTLDVERLTGQANGPIIGPHKVNHFRDGSMGILQKSGYLIYADIGSHAKVVRTAKTSASTTFKSHFDLERLDNDRLFYVADNLDIITIDINGISKTHSAGLKNMKANKKAEKDITINNNSAGCLNDYAEYIKQSKKAQLAGRVISGVAIVFNPIIGLSGLVMTEGFLDKLSREEHAALTLKVLHDAENDIASDEIKAMHLALNSLDSSKFSSTNAVIDGIKKLNSSRQACEIDSKASMSSIKDIMYSLIKE
jgi:hypothetical protein